MLLLLWKRPATLCKSVRQIVGHYFWNTCTICIHGFRHSRANFSVAQRSWVTEQKSFSLAHVCIKSVAEQHLFRRDSFFALHIPCDAHWKGQISCFMRIRCAFELRTVFAISLDNIRYFLQIPLRLSFTLSFTMSFIYFFNFNRRIKCAKERVLIIT